MLLLFVLLLLYCGGCCPYNFCYLIVPDAVLPVAGCEFQLFFSGFPVDDSQEGAGYWGEYICDMPSWTLRNMFQQILEKHPVRWENNTTCAA